MALNQAKAFLEGLASNVKAQEIIKALRAEGEDATFDMYSQAAKDTGFDATADELAKAAAELQEAVAEQSDRTAEVVGELSDEDLRMVAGGKVKGYRRIEYPRYVEYTYCMDNYSPGENCWFADDCNSAIWKYNWTPDGYRDADEPH